MSDRIDHDEIAREHLDALGGWGREVLTTSDILKHGAYAQANAVLALKNMVEDLVEQQRIANEQMAEVIAHVLGK